MYLTRYYNKEYLWIIVLCLAAFFLNNNALPTDIMESRNIVTAREMVQDGNWLVPTMNGELRLEKPPLPTWIAAAIESIHPHALDAQRMAAGVMALVWVAYLYLIAKYISRRRDFARIAVVVFITCYNVILMGRTATWDIYCHAFMMGGIYYLMRGLYDDRFFEHSHKWRWFVTSGVFMGLSFLSKGPVSFYALLLPAIITAVIYQRPYMRGKWLPLFVMILTTVIVGGWWYAYLYICHPEAIDAVIKKESGNWAGHNVRSWFYYWRYFTETGVWTILSLAALFIPYWRKHMKDWRGYLIAITWVLASLVLLSLMPEKKTRYLLPMMAPCSLAVAFVLVYYMDTDAKHLDKIGKWIYWINGYVLAAITVLLPILVHVISVHQGYLDVGTAFFIDALLIGIGVWLGICTKQFNAKGLLYGVASLFFIAECFLIGIIGKSFTNPTGNSIHKLVRVEALKPVAYYYNQKEELRIELVYETRKKIRPLDFNNEQEMLKAMPCLVITRHSMKEELPASLLQKIDTVKIGTFDDNRHPKSDRHYTDLFLNQATLLEVKGGKKIIIDPETIKELEPQPIKKDE